jgi:effector-binding domain-containing protein
MNVLGLTDIVKPLPSRDRHVPETHRIGSIQEIMFFSTTVNCRWRQTAQGQVATLRRSARYSRSVATVEYKVVEETVRAERVAAVRTSVRIGDVGRAWKPALDEVWALLKVHPELASGHNLFLYHHPHLRGEPMIVDFGVQVSHPFARQGNVHCVETPAGEVARTVHVGPYDKLVEAHDAIHAWCARRRRKIAQASWETYGDWINDPSLLETTIRYLLA